MIVILLNVSRCEASSESALFVEKQADCNEWQVVYSSARYLLLAFPPVSVMLAKTFFQVTVFIVTSRFLYHVPYVNLACRNSLRTKMRVLGRLCKDVPQDIGIWHSLVKFVRFLVKTDSSCRSNTSKWVKRFGTAPELLEASEHSEKFMPL